LIELSGFSIGVSYGLESISDVRVRNRSTFLVFAIYCAIDPFSHSSISKFPDFKTYKIDMPPLSSLPKERDRQNLLQNSEIRFLNEVQGPESIAFDPQGRGPYTGVADGRILFWNGTRWTDFAYTSNNR